jgi:hypothetical protein
MKDLKTKQKLSWPFCKEYTFKAPWQRMHSRDSLLCYSLFGSLRTLLKELSDLYITLLLKELFIPSHDNDDASCTRQPLGN